MGADLLGYQAMYPLKFTKDEIETLNQHLKDVTALLNTPSLNELYSKEVDAHGKYTSKLNNLIPSFTSECDTRGFNEDPDEIQDLIDEYKELIKEGYNFIKDHEVDGRDTSWRIYHILGRKYYSVFAGQESWGDEPEGGGYETLKNWDRINVLGIAEGFIPQSQSLHFIKGEEDAE